METENVEIVPDVQDRMSRFVDAVAKEAVVTIVVIVVLGGANILGKEIAARYKRRKMHIVPEITDIIIEE